MKKVIILTHGDLCRGFASAMKVISADEHDLALISIQSEDAVETIQAKIEKECSSADSSCPILLLTDVPFGSSTQTAIPYLEKYANLYIVSGLNLGLLMGVLMEDFNEDIESKLRELVEQSQQTVMFINDLLQNSEE